MDYENIKEKVLLALTSDKKEDEEFEIDGKDFTVRSYSDGVYVWANNGCRSIYSNHTKSKDEKPEVYADIITKRIEEYCNGVIHCCDCGATFPVKEIEGYRRSYFAGVYCQDCWDSKWKAIEAKETYD